jgi:hypothetical protein
MIVFAIGVTASVAVWLAAAHSRAAQANQAARPEKMTLLGTLAEWKYPGSNMLGGASMSDGGNPLVADVKCQAILTTPDAIEKVAKFYADKLATSPAPGGGQNAKAEVKEAAAKAVSTQDDSEGRPVSVQIIVVNRADSTTTLVISRARSEKETHIAWSHYRRFDH